MSGVYGIVAPRADRDLHSLAAGMAQSLAHRPWYVVEQHVEPDCPVALGRIGIGLFNPSAQPVWNASRTVALVMAGESYRAGAQPEAQAANALACYERYGETFAAQLNGAFVIAVWDKPRRRLVITNDRFGLYPLYYTFRSGRLIFAPEIKAILSDASVPREPDRVALAQYMRFQHLLGTRTFWNGIALLPPAAVLVYDLAGNALVVTTYWSFADIPHRPEVRFDEAVQEAGCLLRVAVRRMSGDRFRPGVFLSGGLDSRTILGLMDRRPVTSISYGTLTSHDVHLAERIARAVGSDHHWFDLENGAWVREYADWHLELTEGAHSFIHAHGISTLDAARTWMDVNLTGWDGGTVMGHQDNIEPLQLQAVDERALTTRLYYLFNQKYTWPSLTEPEEGLLYAEPLRTEMRGLAFDSFREELAPFLGYRPDVRSEYFYLRNHCLRLTQSMVTFTRSHLEVRFPFFDYDLFDYLYSLPAPIRGHRTLYRALIQRETPALALIPYANDNLPPTSNRWLRTSYAVAVKLANRIRQYSGWGPPARPTLYADYEEYLRGELRGWAEGILYDERTAARGLFDPAFLHTLMQRHCSGLEQWTIGKIAPIITYEMMLRRFLDTPSQEH